MTIFSVFGSLPFAWTWTGWLSSIPYPSSRGPVITLCIVVICFSLFIMMKKFGPDDRGRSF
jgi:hypothetical protein